MKVTLVAWWTASSVAALFAQTPSTLDFSPVRRLLQESNARQTIEQLVAKAQASGDRGSEALGLAGLAWQDEKEHQPQSAERRMREAARVSPDRLFLGSAARWMAQEFSPFGANPIGERARAWLQTAIDEFRRLDIPRELARALSESAALMSRGTAKEQTLERALAAARAGGDVRDIARIQADWAETLQAKGDLAGAIVQLRDAAARLVELEAWTDAAKALTVLGRSYTLHGQFGEATTSLIRAEELSEKAGDVPGMMQARIQRAMLLALSGQRKDALRILDRVREYFFYPNLQTVRPRLVSLAFAYLVAEGYAHSAEVAETIVRQYPKRPLAPLYAVLSAAYFHLGRYQDSIEAATTGISRSEELPFNQRTAYHWRALALSKLGRHEDAACDIRQAVRLDDSARERLVPEDEWKRAFEEARAPLAQDAIAILWEGGYRREALDAAELYRARALLDLLASRGARAKTPGVERASTAMVTPASSAELVVYARRSGTSVLSYWVHPDAVYGWLVKPGGDVRGFRSPVPAARLDQLAARVRSLRYEPDREAGRKLYRILIEPVRGELRAAPGNKVAIIPHGSLHQLPFGALADAGGRYLAEDFVLASSPAAALLLKPPATPAPPDRIVLVGDPVNAPDGLSGKPLSALPGAHRELARIAALAPGRSALLGAGAASESRVRVEAPKARVLHFATHAVIDAGSPFDSFLALSSRGKLTAGEAYDLDLHADLVTLSACRGGSGKVSSDGMLGLTRAFLYAGAAHVMAPAWDVPDEPTVLLMEEFYRRYLSGTNPAEALRAAQLKLLAELRAGRVVVQTPAGAMTLPEHPALWAGFILYGPA